MMTLWFYLTLALISGSLCSNDATFTHGPFKIKLGDRWDENNELNLWIGENFDVVGSKSQAADFYIYHPLTKESPPLYELWTDSQHTQQVYQVDQARGGYFAVSSKEKVMQMKLEQSTAWQLRLDEYPVRLSPFDLKCFTSDGYGYVFHCESRIVRAYKDKYVIPLQKRGCTEVRLWPVKPEGTHKSKKSHHH